MPRKNSGRQTSVNIRNVGDGVIAISTTISKQKDRKPRDELRWIADGPSGYLVEFQGAGPFVDRTFQVKPGQSKNSGPVRDGVEIGFYKYDIKTPNGEETLLDPLVYVED